MTAARTGVSNVHPGNGLVAQLLRPEKGLMVFGSLVAFAYGAIPLGIYLYIIPADAFLTLALLTLLAIAGMLLGARFPLFDKRLKGFGPRVQITPSVFHTTVWMAFLIVAIVTIATAPSVPLVSALEGASASALSQERGEFLKAREGAEIILLYLATFLVSTFVPYSIVLLYDTKARFRHVAAALFFAFCVSFLQKALFLNLVLPLLAYLAITNKLTTRRIFFGFFASVALLLAATALTVGGDSAADHQADWLREDFLSSVYVPKDPIQYFVWRAFAVPVFTATDTLVVHAEQFGAQPLLGATSTLLASLFGMERINLERFVFEYQFGGWNELANSNAVYITDAYANFGYVGVLVFALIVGQILRWFRVSRDVAFKCLWPVFAFTAFSSSLIPTLLSGGFLFLLAFAALMHVGSRARPQPALPANGPAGLGAGGGR